MNQNIPPVTKNLLIINALVFLATYVLGSRYGLELSLLLGLNYFSLEQFHFYQLFSYMFIHADFWHLFFNMFSLWMFGRIIEHAWGPKRFIIYYLVCGLGAALCQEVFQFVQVRIAWSNGEIPILGPTVGASGAIYGILLAFGMTFPNERIMLLIPPIPMKAKYFVILFAGIELYSAISGSGGNIAHCAHLGGMLFGWFLILYWRNRGGGNGRNNTFNDWNSWKPKKKSRWENFRLKLKSYLSNRNKSDNVFKDRNKDYDFNARNKEKEARVDAILDKIKRSGYDSLTSEEKKELFKNSSK